MSRKFPERIIVDFGDADAEGFPKISEAIAFEMPCDTVEVALSDEEACKYVREDIVDHIQTERDRYRTMLERLDKYFNSDRWHLWHLEANAQVDLVQMTREIKDALRGSDDD